MEVTAEGGGMPAERNDENGRYERRYTHEVVLDALHECESPASTREITDALGCSQSLALRRLRELEDDDRVSARPVGNTFLWTLEASGDE